MRHLYSFLFSLLLTTLGLAVHAQFTTVGTATSSSPGIPNATCFRLTNSLIDQAGAVWSNTPIDLSQNFTLTTKLYFGAVDAGADGLAFVLRDPNAGAVALGTGGGGLGYWGIAPSFVVEFDTWQNNGGCFSTGDPAGDHIGFQRDGNPFHTQGPPPCNFPSGALQAPTEFASNIEDGQWHDATFSWNASTHTFTVSIFGQTYSFTGDIVNTIFGGTSSVLWGFTAATGAGSGVGNEHGVCITTTPPECGQLRTVTQGGWGAEPHGNNPGTYLHAHFATVFPSGLTVGTTPNFNVHLTSAQAITNLLPTGGTPKALTQSYTDPATLKNVLVGQLVALTLNVQFDAADPNFAPSGVTLGDMLIASGPFEGMTVNAFLALANQVLGGTNTTYTAAQVNETADAINNSSDGGNGNSGFLECPNANNGLTQRLSPRSLQLAEAQNFRVWPNPARGQFAFQLTDTQSGSAQVLITNANGTVVQSRTVSNTTGQTVKFDLGKQAAGMYLIRVITNKGVQTQKLLIQK